MEKNASSKYYDSVPKSKGDTYQPCRIDRDAGEPLAPSPMPLVPCDIAMAPNHITP